MNIPCFRMNCYGIMGDIDKERLTIEHEALPTEMRDALHDKFDNNNEATFIFEDDVSRKVEGIVILCIQNTYYLYFAAEENEEDVQVYTMRIAMEDGILCSYDLESDEERNMTKRAFEYAYRGLSGEADGELPFEL
ncbi:MAG: hypothetical protein MR029_11725 [Clostridium sp.]|nr:hypothetical protein [Clostridium sp.]